jgi:hypothetical protein
LDATFASLEVTHVELSVGHIAIYLLARFPLPSICDNVIRGGGNNTNTMRRRERERSTGTNVHPYSIRGDQQCRLRLLKPATAM